MRHFQEGTFKGVGTDYGGEVRDGKNPAVWFAFSVKFPDGLETMTFRSYVHTESAAEFTFKVLNTLGYTGKNLDDLIAGFDSNALPVGREVDVVVELGEPDERGNKFFNIKYVNSPNAGPSVKRAPAAVAKAALEKFNATAAFKKFRAQNPAPDPEPWP